jgi:hypothetical protein
MTIDFSAWTTATAELLPGQQAVFLDVLNLVASGDVHLVYGADYRDGKPCLVNAVGQMLTTSGGNGIPMQQFREVVTCFDSLNAEMLEAGINDSGYVSGLAAEFLIRNFGEVKPMDLTPQYTDEQIANGQPYRDKIAYVEPSDEQFLTSWLEAMKAPAPESLAERMDAEADYARAHIEFPRRT